MRFKSNQNGFLVYLLYSPLFRKILLSFEKNIWIFDFFRRRIKKRVVGFFCFRFHNLIYGIGYFFRRSRNGGFSGFSNFHKKRHSSPFFHKFFLHNLWILWITLWKTYVSRIFIVDKTWNLSTFSTVTFFCSYLP